MIKFVESMSKMSAVALSIGLHEVERFSEADIHWSINKSAAGTFANIKKGNIYQFEFGKGYSPEMAYEHRGLVIGMSSRLLYVLPIFTYNASNKEHKNASHYIDNPSGSNNYYLLKQSEFPFLKRNSIIKLNDIRTVSVARIKYSHKYRIDPSSDVYKFIEQKVFARYFGNIAFEYNNLKAENEMLKEELRKLKKSADES